MCYRFMLILHVVVGLCIYAMCLYMILRIVGEIIIHFGGQT